MRHLTYNGPAGNVRALGKADGLTADYEFHAGVPLEVSEESAELLLDPAGPFAGDGFTEGEPPEAADDQAGDPGNDDPEG